MKHTWKTCTALLLSLMLLIPFTGCDSTQEVSDSADSSTAAESSAADAADTDTDDDTDSDDDTDADTEAATEAGAILQGDIPATYDSAVIDDACAKVICDYFKAISKQDYTAYKATLNKEYFQVYNSWLNAAYGYGMESSFELQHESLMDLAQAERTVIITGLDLKLPEKEQSTEELVAEYLADYDAIIGEGFAENIQNTCDEILIVQFTMTGECDGTEREILNDMEILVTVKDGEYRLLG